MSQENRMLITNPETKRDMKCKFKGHTTFGKFANGPYDINATKSRALVKSPNICPFLCNSIVK